MDKSGLLPSSAASITFERISSLALARFDAAGFACKTGFSGKFPLRSCSLLVPPV